MAGIKGIWIPAGIDVENLKKDAETSKAIIAAQTATLVDEVQKQVGVTDKAAQAHDSLQKQYRAASREASALAGANGQLSASALEATAKAGKLKDELMDYREVEKTLGSKAPVFAAFGNATKVAAGGIEAATGAMALFGAKSEDTELMLQHVMGAMAFSKGIQELAQMGDAFIAIKAVITANVIPAIVQMNAFLMANPIFLIAAAVAAAGVAIWALTKDWTDTEAAEKAAAEEAKKYEATVKAVIENIIKGWKTQSDTYDLYLKSLKDGDTKWAGEQAKKQNDEIKAVQTAVMKKEITISEGEQRISFIMQRFANERETRDEENKRKTVQLKVDELERKKAYEGSFSNWSESQELHLLEVKKGALKAGTKEYLDNLNQIKIAEKSMANTHAQAVRVTWNINTDLGKTDAIGKELSKGLDPKNFELKPIKYTLKADPLKDVKDNITKSGAELTVLQKEISNDISSGVNGSAQAVGAAIANNNNVAEAAGQALLKTLGDIAIKKGEFYTAMGAAEITASMGTDPMGYAHIAGGAALIVAGAMVGAMGASSSGGSSSSSGGGSSYTPSQYSGWQGTGGANTGSGSSGGSNLSLVSKISGRDMQIILTRNNVLKKRSA